MSYSGLGLGALARAVSRRFSSASTASLINSARRFGPRSASMRSGTPMGSRTCVPFTLSGGRPMRPRVTDAANPVKTTPKACTLIDVIPVHGYKSNLLGEVS